MERYQDQGQGKGAEHGPGCSPGLVADINHEPSLRVDDEILSMISGKSMRRGKECE